MFEKLFVLFSRIRGLFTSGAQDREFDHEMREHLRLLAADFERRGMSPSDARRAALKQFGGLSPLKDDLHDRRSLPLLETLYRDLRYTLRGLRKSPLFTATVVVTLALGIGANTAIFTLTDQALLRMLPVKEPRQLVLLTPKGRFIGGSMRNGMSTFSYPKFIDLRDANPGVFTGIAARYEDNVDVTSKGVPERAIAELVSGNYFQLLCVTSAIGRTLTPEDDRIIDGSPYVVLSYQYWSRQFGADPSVLNRTIDVNGQPMTVVGVAQRGFAGFASMTPADLFVPLAMKKTVTPTWDDRARRDSIWLKVFARLAPGVSREAAKSAMAVAYHRTLETDLQTVPRSPGFAKNYLRGTIDFSDAARGYDELQKSFAKPLYLLLAMVGLLLLIACVNVANLQMSRAASRQQEIGVRLSLGATRGALIRMVLTESLTLSLAGGAVGLVLSYWVARLLVSLMPYDNIGYAFRLAPDLRILGFTAALSITAALLFGLAPALQASRAVAPALKKYGMPARKLLVVAQVALSLLLLIGAGLFGRSLYKVLAMDRSIETAHLLTFHTDPSLHRYNPTRAHQLIIDLQNRLRAIPGVVAAGGSMVALMSGENWTNTVQVEGYRPHEKEEMTFGWNAVTPGYFATLGVPLVAGRDFSERDAGDKITKAIVNETFAKRFAPGGNIVGLHMGFGGSGPTPVEIVGVVRDIKNTDVTDKPRPFHYTPMLEDRSPEIQFYLRAHGDPLALVSAVRRELAQADSSLPMLDVRTVDAQIDQTHYLERLFAWLTGAFGALATILASIGLYGVTAFAVARRTREIGIRIALGAGRKRVLRMVMREVLLLSTVGVISGLALSLSLGRFVESQLYEMKGTDPLIEGSSTLAIVVVSALAAYLPARRAARIEPLTALRYE